MSTLRRSFQTIDKDECGFISSSSLESVLREINVHGEYNYNEALGIVDHPEELAKLRGLLQTDGDIIIWNCFWENVSKLMSGDSLDSLLDRVAVAFHPIDSSLPSSTSTTMQLQSVDNNNISVCAPRKRSDSEIAREVQNLMDADPNLDFNAAFTAAAAFDSAATKTTQAVNTNEVKDNHHGKRFRSDSELARELQAQFDMETDNINDSTVAVDNNRASPITVNDTVDWNQTEKELRCQFLIHVDTINAL